MLGLGLHGAFHFRYKYCGAFRFTHTSYPRACWKSFFVVPRTLVYIEERFFSSVLSAPRALILPDDPASPRGYRSPRSSHHSVFAVTRRRFVSASDIHVITPCVALQETSQRVSLCSVDLKLPLDVRPLAVACGGGYRFTVTRTVSCR